ncbi:MAG TPA: kelch repeat-containing protein [Rubricoccaceae bacterium]
MSRLFVFAGLLLATSAVPAAQAWQAAAPMATPRADAAWTVSGGRLYVFGGRRAGGTLLRSVEVFDPATGWSAMPPMDRARADARAVVLNGDFYVLGGRDASGALDDVERFDSRENRWRSASSLDEARIGHGAGVVGGQIYAVGGAGEYGPLLRSAERYEDEDWNPYAPWTLAQPRALAGSASVGGAVVLAGGFGPAGPVGTVERFVPGASAAPLPSLLRARGALALATDGATLFAVGGRDAGNVRVADVERLTAGASAWTALSPLPEGREGAVAAVLGPDLYVVGGTDEFGTVLTSVVRLPMVAVGEEDTPALGTPGLTLTGPHPARGAVRLRVTLDRAEAATVTITDIRGRVVATLADGPLAAGTHEIRWNASALPAGIFAARLTTASGTSAVLVTLVR